MRAVDKQFTDGQQVLLLEKDGEGELISKWTGPATVVRKTRPYSYLIKLDNGACRTVHANKLRAYHARVNIVGMIFEGDAEFGDVPTFPMRSTPGDELP